ncbi:tRNA methyl transferase [Phytophthora infestans]|nr:tRNA methyl transferase [Phytophthora infestans]
MLLRTWKSAAASAQRRRQRALFGASSRLSSLRRRSTLSTVLDVSAVSDYSKKHVVVGMSGGVDSSVAALLLKRQGYHVTGVYMKNWDPSDEEGESACPVDSEYVDVQKVCEQLGIEAQMVNLVQSYWNQVFAPCLAGYEEGLTPNPDILCNREIKFKAFTEFAKQIGADCVATGHYAALRPAEKGGPPNLCAAEDESKDQSYFLSSVDGKAFANVLFPLGGMRKTEVRQIAESEGLCTATKKDSVGICFIGKRNFADFIHQYIQRQDGYFYTVGGEKMHPHHGFTAYTVGQGARLQGMSAKWFVVGKHKFDHSVIVAEGTRNPALFSDALFASAEQFNWMAGDLPPELRDTGRMRCFYRVRYRQDLDKCTISLVSNREARASASKLHDWQPELVANEEGVENGEKIYLRVDFDHPQRGVTPEQALVLYRSDGLCYGGGPIAAAGQTYYEQGKALADDVHDWHRQGREILVLNE